MFERLARWIFNFRTEIISVLSALTVWTTFTAARVTLEGAHPEPPPADVAIERAQQAYDAAFPPTRKLAVLVTAGEGSRLDGPAGRSWLDAVEALLSSLRAPPPGPQPTPQESIPPPLRRLGADGRSAVIETEVPPETPLDFEALSTRLSALQLATESDSRFTARLLEPEPPAGFLSNWMSTLGPLITGGALLGAGLLAYSGSFVLTGLTIGAALLAIIWQVGIWATFGGSIQPALRFVPALIFVLTLSHGFLVARHVMRALAAGASPLEAATGMVRRLAPSGGPALAGVALALVAGALAPVPAARETLAFAALGVLMILPCLFIVMPLLLSRMRIDRPPEAVSEEPAKKPRRVKPGLSLRQAAAGPQTIVLLALALALVAALESEGRLLGPIGASELGRSTSAAWLALADEAAAGPGSTRATLSVIARAPPETCMQFDVLDAVDRLSWRLANLPGVTQVESVPIALRQLQADSHDGDPRWRDVPRKRNAALQSLAKIPEAAALIDRQCRMLIIRVYAAPPFARVLSEVDAAVARFRAENAESVVHFELAGGSLARALSEQRVLSRYQGGIFLAMLTALVGVVFLGLKDWRGAAAMTVMGLALSLAAGWAVASVPIGLTGETVALVLLAVLLPADMAVYVITGWRALAGSPDADPLRRRLWQRHGQALLARALSVSLCFAVWLTAADPAERSLAQLSIATALAGAVTALFVIPAVSMLLEHGSQRKTPASA